eukprot:7391157-Prymnesium_polylepis.1
MAEGQARCCRILRILEVGGLLVRRRLALEAEQEIAVHACVRRLAPLAHAAHGHRLLLRWADRAQRGEGEAQRRGKQEVDGGRWKKRQQHGGGDRGHRGEHSTLRQLHPEVKVCGHRHSDHRGEHDDG